MADVDLALDEIQTRQQLIDHQLAKAGWSVEANNLQEEVRVATTRGETDERGGSVYRTSQNFVDYMLLGQNGLPIGIVEAKRTSRSVHVGREQAAEYADALQQRYGVEPFIFLSNGREILFWDRSLSPPRQVSGFFTPADLERLAFQRRYRQELRLLGPRRSIIDRDYQILAVKQVTEALVEGRRHFLLVMATGTGKTRTIIALIDLLIQAKWIRRVLFLADRRELVKQALGDFKEHMPDETRARIEGGEVDDAARIHVATYPSMAQVYGSLSPGYYDLIVADESHRSIYNYYSVLFEHFDALQIGLTATPTDFIDHNTFALFNCPDGLPTFYYPYEQAVKEEYLADYRVLDAQTAFQIEGIRAGQLPPAVQRQLEEQGIDLDEIDFEGSDLERQVTNTGTTDAMVREFMEKCRKDAGGTLPAKTIFFAMGHNHAERILESFDRLYPDRQRQGMAKIIDSHMERVDQTLADFKRKSMPRVAISVDMLDTGIDVPAIQNLVFAKPVFSQVKFWQMIGRGTRRWTDPETGRAKDDFLIIDFWNNFAYFRMNPEGEIPGQTEALPVRLFRLRLEKVALLRGQDNGAAAAEVVGELIGLLAQIPTENVNVRPFLGELAELASPAAWTHLSAAHFEQLGKEIAPLLRFMPDVNLPVMSFEARAERLAVAHLTGQRERVAQLREAILEDIDLLPAGLAEVQAEEALLAWVRSNGFWEHLDYARIEELRRAIAPLMRFRQRRRAQIIELNLPDEIARRRWIIYGPSGEGAFADSYRERVEAQIKELAREHPTLHKVQRGEALTEADVARLAETLNRPDTFVTEEVLQEVYEQPSASLLDFVRHILDLGHLPSREEIIRAEFDAFLAQHPHFTATQIIFLRALRAVVLSQRRITRLDLERPPFSRIAPAHFLFSQEEVNEILSFANRLAA